MPKTPIEDLLKQCPSIYKLVVIAARRAKELAEGAPKFIDTDVKKVTSIALEEIHQGKVACLAADHDEEGREPKAKKRTKESGTRSRAAHAGDKKKS